VENGAFAKAPFPTLFSKQLNIIDIILLALCLFFLDYFLEETK